VEFARYLGRLDLSASPDPGNTPCVARFASRRKTSFRAMDGATVINTHLRAEAAVKRVRRELTIVLRALW
jgi:hypothetical protein